MEDVFLMNVDEVEARLRVIVEIRRNVDVSCAAAQAFLRFPYQNPFRHDPMATAIRHLLELALINSQTLL